MGSFPPNSNPFNHDAYHMGQRMGTNCFVMMENHNTAICNYLIIIDTVTGKRLKVIITEPKSTLTADIVNHINGFEAKEVSYIPHSLISSIDMMNDEEVFICIFTSEGNFKSVGKCTSDANGITGSFVKL